jgi:hypothetical protein
MSATQFTSKGTSPGEINEMLMRPREWDKCTPAMQGLYRKMYAWAMSEAKKNLLKEALF